MPSGAELTEAIPSDPQRRPVLTPSRSRRRHDHVSNDDIFLRAAGWTGGLATARVDRVRSSSKLDSPTRIALKANSSRSGHQPKRTSAFITSTIGSRLSTGTQIGSATVRTTVTNT